MVIQMKIDFSSILTDIDGQAMTDKDKPVTLKTVSQIALLAAFDDERGLSGDEKVKRFILAEKIGKKPICDLKAEEIAEIKKCIGKGYPPIIVGRAWSLLDKTEEREGAE